MLLNKTCALEDWSDPALAATMCAVIPYFRAAYPDYPHRREHRKHWEYAHVVNGLEFLGALHPEAFVLSVAGGHEEPAFYLTTRARWVFVTDLYGTTAFANEADATMLTNPDAFARCPFNRRRLVVEHMNALDLRFEDNTFDTAFSLSSMEHFGGFEAAVQALGEMCRVLKPGGIAAITTECIVNGAPELHVPGLSLFSGESLDRLAASSALRLIEPVRYASTPATAASAVPLHKAVQNAGRGIEEYPLVALEYEGRIFTSVAMFWRKPR